jgi:hypothetical protein
MSSKITTVCFVRLKLRVMEFIIVGGWEAVEFRLRKENFSAGRK